jgi:hypothetical protein
MITEKFRLLRKLKFQNNVQKGQLLVPILKRIYAVPEYIFLNTNQISSSGLILLKVRLAILGNLMFAT